MCVATTLHCLKFFLNNEMICVSGNFDFFCCRSQSSPHKKFHPTSKSQRQVNLHNNQGRNLSTKQKEKHLGTKVKNCHCSAAEFNGPQTKLHGSSKTSSADFNVQTKP